VERLALKYRPKSFDEVIEQEHSKRILQQLIATGQNCANLLLYGSIGSGKTSLVRIYAKALSCASPTTQGEPCLKCDPCKEMEKGDVSNYAELDAPGFQKLSDVKNRIGSLLSSEVKQGQRRVIFVDEAHSLANFRDSYEFLLKKVEEPPPGVSFCFATTAIERIAPALRSRLIQLEVRPLSHDRSISFLGDIASKEGLTFEPEALSLLVGLGEHQPRNMLQALDQMRIVDLGNVFTRDRVAKIFSVDHVENLVVYFEALGSADFKLQTESFFGWREPVRTKIRLIQQFLVGVYYRDFCGVNVSVDPVIASIRPKERDRVLEAFRRRLGDVDLKAFWEDMLSAWPVITNDLSDEALLTHVIRLQNVANRSDCSPRSETYVDRVAVEALPEGESGDSAKKSRIAKNSDDLTPTDPKYLTRSHVAKIFASSSFLIQEGYKAFNAQITIRHSLFGAQQQPEASEHFAEFSKALKSRLEHWNGSAPRLFVQEKSETDGSCSRVVAFIPNAADAARWLNKWQRSERISGCEEDALRLEMLPAGPRLEAHWRCVRWLCGGFNPQDPIFGKLNIEPEYQRVAGDIEGRTRVGCSDLLAPLAIAKAQEIGLQLVSAFDDQQWDRLYDGWEIEECASRLEHKLILEEAIARVEALYPLDGSPQTKEIRESELAELRARFGARARRRSWPIWDLPQ